MLNKAKSEARMKCPITGNDRLKGLEQVKGDLKDTEKGKYFDGFIQVNFFLIKLKFAFNIIICIFHTDNIR